MLKEINYAKDKSSLSNNNASPLKGNQAMSGGSWLALFVRGLSNQSVNVYEVKCRDRVLF